MGEDEIRIDDLDRYKKQLKEKQSYIHKLEKTIAEVSRKQRQYTIESPKYDNTIVFGLISDTHLGSLYECTSGLNEFLKLCKSEKIKEILHAGDVLDGNRMYHGQEFELYAHGFDEQLKALYEKVETPKGLKVNFIGGNHDESYWKQSGIKVGTQIAERTGWKYLGAEFANVTFKTKSDKRFKIHLLHPGGGTAYAISYRSQKIVESLAGGTKPHMLIMGHFHKADHLPQIRNVSAIQAGCFQYQTPFMRRRGNDAHVGGWIIQVVFLNSNTLRVKTEFISFYDE